MVPDEVSFKDKNGIWMTRRQLPLSLGYATTVHRSQCMIYKKLVVDLTGINWKPGMFYTILSRTRKLTDIIILAYDRKSFKVACFCMTIRQHVLTCDICGASSVYTGSFIYIKTTIYIGDANKRKQGLIEVEKREDDIIRYQ
jgi:hypothetical protein